MSETTSPSTFLLTQVRGRRKFLNTTGTILQWVAWVQVIGAIIGGIALALYTRDDAFGESERPFVLQGLIVAINGAAVGLVMLVIGTLAVYVTSRDGVAAFQASLDG